MAKAAALVDEHFKSYIKDRSMIFFTSKVLFYTLKFR